jgi:hypothetical protein
LDPTGNLIEVKFFGPICTPGIVALYNDHLFRFKTSANPVMFYPELGKLHSKITSSVDFVR